MSMQIPETTLSPFGFSFVLLQPKTVEQMKRKLFVISALLLVFFVLSCEKKKNMVRIETPYGSMLVELYDETPQHRDNFLKLAEEGFYDSLLFHRVMQGFMIQGGDPDSRDARPGQQLGMGGPGYTIPAEFNPKYIHVKGALAAARQGDAVNPQRASSGSQFYIVHGRPYTDAELNQIEQRNGITYTEEQRKAYKTIGGAPFLDGQYTVFGKVVEGLEVIDKIAEQPVDRANRPLKDITMKISVE